jgi:GTP-binding protein
VRDLVSAVAGMLAGLPRDVPRAQPVHRFSMEPDFRVERAGPGEFRVSGARVQRLVAMTDMANDEAVEALARRLRAMGLEEDLASAGAERGDTVRIGDHELTYEPD